MSMLQVSKVCQPLDDLRDLAASDSVDTFVLSYTSLLQARAEHLCACPEPVHDRSHGVWLQLPAPCRKNHGHKRSAFGA